MRQRHRLNFMKTSPLPPHDEMVRAMLASDQSYEGVFYTAVKTTGIFCRPTCPARKPKPENVVFYRAAEDALTAGYRPCLRCKPLDASGIAPEWVTEILQRVDRAPNRRWTDEDLIQLNVDPLRLRRWFKEHYGTTFHTHIRARRLALALGSLKQGASIDDTAHDHGYESLSGFRDALQQNLQTTPGAARTTPLLLYTRLLTPLGPMIAMAEDRGLVLLEFVDRPALSAEVEELRSRYGYTSAPGRNTHLDRVEEEITAYFAGTLQNFSVPLITPGTEFQNRVWTALRRLGYGVTSTYGSVAESIGSPNASRAVGHANGQNRISIIIPCHRVIGSDGSLTGYGGGQPRKAFLLDLERETLHAGDDTPISNPYRHTQSTLF
jgi:AraC family transcriptional regulator, regulatory protein of adaptative response / methylated-DNA-[protein]-cysteine methyltransferase